MMGVFAEAGVADAHAAAAAALNCVLADQAYCLKIQPLHAAASAAAAQPLEQGSGLQAWQIAGASVAILVGSA